MNYTQAMIDMARHHLTEEGMKLFLNIESRMPDIWDKFSSSTQKYHKKEDGTVPTIAHHTYEMFYGACKIIRMFGGKLKSKDNDAILMSILLHDIQKYGPKGNMPHTNNYHDRSMADLLGKNKKALMRHFTEKQADVLITGVRYHSGRWSKSVPNINKFVFEDYHPIVMFVHIFDMLSTADCLKFPEVNNEGR